MATVATGGMTIDEFHAMPDHEDYELIDGELRPLDGELGERFAGLQSSHIGLRIGGELDRYSQTGGGWAFGADDGYAVFGEFGGSLEKARCLLRRPRPHG